MRPDHHRHEVVSNFVFGGIGICHHVLSSTAAEIIAANSMQSKAGPELGATECREPALSGIHAEASFRR